MGNSTLPLFRKRIMKTRSRESSESSRAEVPHGNGIKAPSEGIGPVLTTPSACCRNGSFRALLEARELRENGAGKLSELVRELHISRPTFRQHDLPLCEGDRLPVLANGDASFAPAPSGLVSLPLFFFAALARVPGCSTRRLGGWRAGWSEEFRGFDPLNWERVRSRF